MSQTAKLLKRTLRGVVENTPVLVDYYYSYWLFARNANLYRGVFSSFSEAAAAVPAGSPAGYNHAEIHSPSLEHHPDISEISQLKPIDYPVLVWLGEAFKSSAAVFDLGGNIGQSYYAYQNYISYPPDLRWTVCDVPEAVKIGTDFSTQMQASGLSFTTSSTDAEGHEIFITCGTLQYLESTLAELLAPLRSQPRHLIINHVPFYDGPSYITLQNLLVINPVRNSQISSYTPYKIQNREQFVRSLTALGYQLVDAWQQERTCYIPFHPERQVQAYHGFYFQYFQD